MLSYLHRLSGFLFYLLVTSFFVAYLLHFNHMLGSLPLWWMQIADLPLAVVAMLYSGTSLYQSIVRPEQPSKFLTLCIGIPLTALFALFFVMNYWDLLKGDTGTTQTLWLNWVVIEAVTILIFVIAWRRLRDMKENT